MKVSINLQTCGIILLYLFFGIKYFFMCYTGAIETSYGIFLYITNRP